MITHIRCANEKDAGQIAKVHIDSWQATYRGIIPDSFLDNLSVEKRKQEWIQYLQSGTQAWVAISNAKVIGFVSICPTRDTDDDAKKIAEISSIYLLPAYLNKGIGKQLCQAAFNQAIKQNFKEMTVWVLEKNSKARHFYEKLGFSHKVGDVEFDHIGCESLQVVRYRKLFEFR